MVPKLLALGWDSEPHSIAEQRTVTDGRVIPVGKESFVRKSPKRVDFLLRYTRDFPLAVVEAKATYKTAADAVQQARSYLLPIPRSLARDIGPKWGNERAEASVESYRLP